MPTTEQLKSHYSAATDQELREAAAAGIGAYNAEAWAVIQAEASRRRLDVVAPTEPEFRALKREAPQVHDGARGRKLARLAGGAILATYGWNIVGLFVSMLGTGFRGSPG